MTAAARTAVTLVASAGIWATVLVVAWLSTVADWAIGRVFLVVACGVGAPAALRAVLTPVRRTSLVAAIALVGAWVGIQIGLTAPPGWHALRRELDRLGLERSLERVSAGSGGTPLCFDECPSVDRTYRLGGSSDIEMIARRLRSAGYRVDVDMDVRVVRASRPRFTVGVSAPSETTDSLITVWIRGGESFVAEDGS
jgi:hypothetical protein